MNICIIGEGLTSLSLAKNLMNKKINVHMYYKNLIQNLPSSRTIGISKDNMNFFQKEIKTILKKNYWEIKKIKIYSHKIEKESLIKFENNKNNLFYMVKNDEIYKILRKKIFKNKFFKRIAIKKNFNKKVLDKKEYDLIINCDSNNFLAKKYFTKKIEKDYFNRAYTTIFTHKKIENNTAIQIFTKFGPIAFLPISKIKTSVVCSLDIRNKKFNEKEVLKLINENNKKYEIKKFLKLTSFKLTASNSRDYCHKNILAFGDLLHRIHPLAGQGFNMNIRDIKTLSEIIKNKIELGLSIDSSVLTKFKERTQNKNFLFSNSINFIYEVFNFEKKFKNKNFNKILNVIGKNKQLNNLLIKFADRGFNF